jgi:adenine-specific DNA-methyltransferase
VINTQGVKYIGSKDKLIPFIKKAIEKTAVPSRTAIDVFTGTTRVAQALKCLGFSVYTSDLSWASECYAETFVSNKNNKHLQKIIDELNAIQPEEDWITKNYCDVIADGNVVRVWQKKNGMKADAIRNKIEKLNLEKWEKSTLITSLIFALDVVDNTCGVQQAYLKDWCQRSFKNLILKLPRAIDAPEGKHFTGDALRIDYPKADLAYLDPPYTAHSYATYYHIWDSIAKWDKPEVSLKTNRRIDRVSGSENFDIEMSSLWNKKAEALSATKTLMERLPVKYIILSYNNEGIIKQEDLFSMLKEFRNIEVEEIDYKRNIMSSIGNATIYKEEFRTKNKEFIIIVEK